MPDNANPILKTNLTHNISNKKISSSPSSTSLLTDHQRRRFLRRVQQAAAEEDAYGLDTIDLADSKAGSGESSGGNSPSSEEDEERIDSQEIFDLVRSITDPEHPLTLEALSVVSPDQISVSYPTHDPDRTDSPHVLVRFTPTIPHCSMATLIGLTLRVRLLRSLPDRFKVDIKIKEGTHQSENSVNKQLNDKERVAAALENNHLLGVVQQCLSTAHLRGAKPES
ncbi:uncharacterized protein VP01_3878g1 [Puccinia sorghi]|uniref:Uncharacterized protein n=1 Tax=Puccinia sorghi TaxID=27349 RepID=A0A0L6USX5_9BASI|nr:uncharacterized protein VP01_3878g1 [Puccinia sorghi]